MALSSQASRAAQARADALLDRVFVADYLKLAVLKEHSVDEREYFRALEIRAMREKRKTTLNRLVKQQLTGTARRVG